MSQFHYKVRDGAGALDSGWLEAASLDAATSALRGQGKFVIDLEEDGKAHRDSDDEASTTTSTGGLGTRRIKRDEVITFANQLAIMVDTGVPIGEALESLAIQSQNPTFQAVIREVTDQVQSGTELSEALGAYPKVFPRVMISLIHAAEASGTLGPMLEQISKYLATEHATRKKIRGALTYPAVMLVMVLAVTTFLLVFVLPKFTKIYQSKGAALPAPTRLLMFISNTLIGYWPFVIGGAVVLGVGLFLGLRTKPGRGALDWLKLHTPVLGPLFSSLYITRTCRTMGTLITAGVPILDMIAIVRDVTNNSYFDRFWDEVDNQLRTGSQLSEPFFESPLIPRSLSQMVCSGEKAGRLGYVINKVAAHTEEEFDDKIKQTTQYIEPALVGLMGVIIGFIAISLLLPIFKISSVVTS